jgi:protocatechuate 3,4-dioxygenase beta subunit
VIERELELLAIRAADGELDAVERDRLAELLKTHPELSDFYEREKEAAAAADTFGAGLRLPPGGLEQEVLKRMGMKRRSYKWLWLGAGVAAAAVLVVSLQMMSDAGGSTRGERRGPTAAFEPLVGRGPEPVDHGAFRLSDGINQIEVDEPTLLETAAGIVELEPGRYEVRVEQGRVTVGVLEGAAVLHNASGRQVVAAGETKSLVRAPVAVAAAPAPVYAEAGPGATVTGRVVDGEGQPIPGAHVWVSQTHQNDDGKVVAHTGEDGHYRAASVDGAARLVGARAPGFAPTDLRMIQPNQRAVFQMDFVMRHKGGTLALVVLDAETRPVAGAAVVLSGYYRDTPGANESPEGYPLVAVGGRKLKTDAQGRALAEGLPPQWNRIEVVAAGFAPFLAWERVAPEGTQERTLVLTRGAVLRGRVHDRAGAPVAGAQVRLWDGSGTLFAGIPETRTQADGTFRIDHAPAVRVQIRVIGADGSQAVVWLQLADGEETVWQAVLENAQVMEGRLLDESGEPVAKALLWCQPTRGAGGAPLWTHTDAEGQFRFEKLAAVQHRLSAWYPGVVRGPPVRAVDRLPEQSPVTITLPVRVAEPEPGFIAGSLTRRDGHAAAEAVVQAWPSGQFGWRKTGRTAADGSFRLGPLAPGRYDLELHLDGEPTLRLLAVGIRPGEAKNLGALAFPEGGRIRARLLDLKGEPTPSPYLWVTSTDMSVYYTVEKPEDGGILSEELAPGRYLVAGGAGGLFQEVDVTAGQTTQVELQMRTGSRLDVTLLLEDGRPPAEFSFRIEDAKERSVYYGDRGAGENELKFWLVTGTYTVHCTDGHERKAEETIEITDAQTATRLQVTLR